MNICVPLPTASSRLPVWRLLAFTLAGFIAIVTETVSYTHLTLPTILLV
mgnify:CR=1 FL=1